MIGHCSWNKNQGGSDSRRPTLCSERKNQNRALRKGWGTLSLVSDRKKHGQGGPPVQEASSRVAKGGQPDPIPVTLLARLAIDKREQGKGLGPALLKDALLRVEQASDIIGIRAVLVHAIDQNARGFYKKFDFEESPGNDLHLMLLMKDLRASLR